MCWKAKARTCHNNLQVPGMTSVVSCLWELEHPQWHKPSPLLLAILRLIYDGPDIQQKAACKYTFGVVAGVLLSQVLRAPVQGFGDACLWSLLSPRYHLGRLIPLGGRTGRLGEGVFSPPNS